MIEKNKVHENIEHYKVGDLLKFTELVLEKNYKLYLGIIVVLTIVQSLMSFIPIESDIVYLSITNITVLVTIGFVVFILKKVKIDADIIEKRRQKGNIVKQILVLLAYYFMLVAIIGVVVFAILSVASINEYLTAVVALGLLLLSLPLLGLGIYMSVCSEAMLYEVFIKNNAKLSVLKTVLFNMHKSKNRTFLKMLVSSFIAIAVSIVLTLIAVATMENYLMVFVVNALNVTVTLFLYTYSFIVYMSAVTE